MWIIHVCVMSPGSEIIWAVQSKTQNHIMTEWLSAIYLFSPTTSKTMCPHSRRGTKMIFLFCTHLNSSFAFKLPKQKELIWIVQLSLPFSFSLFWPLFFLLVFDPYTLEVKKNSGTAEFSSSSASFLLPSLSTVKSRYGDFYIELMGGALQASNVQSIWISF